MFPGTTICARSPNVQLYDTINPSGSRLPAEPKVTVWPGTGLKGLKLMFALGNSSAPDGTAIRVKTVELLTNGPLKALTFTVHIPGVESAPVGMVRLAKAIVPGANVTVSGNKLGTGQIPLQPVSTSWIVIFPEKPRSLMNSNLLVFSKPIGIRRGFGNAINPKPGPGPQMFVCTRLAPANALPVGVLMAKSTWSRIPVA